jgi:hypothetical protein
MDARLPAALAAVLTLAFAADAQAAACRDAKGKFVACPAPAASAAQAKGERCRNAKGKFTACPAPGATAAATPAAAPAASAPAAPRASMARTGGAANTAAVTPGAATARCKDGTLSYSKHHSGACASHGGVAQWM